MYLPSGVGKLSAGLAGVKAELTLEAGYVLGWFSCPLTIIHPSSNYLIAT